MVGFVRRGRPNGVDRMVPWTKPRFRHLAASQDREDPFSHMAGGPDLSACPEGSLNAKGPRRQLVLVPEAIKKQNPEEDC